MTRCQDRFGQVHGVLDALLDSARELRALSCEGDFFSRLQALQDDQEELVAHLKEHDAALREDVGPSWKREVFEGSRSVADKLAEIQEYTEVFIQNLTVRRGLLQLEIQDLNKAKIALSDLKTHYGSKASANGARSGALKSKSRINTLS